jgi:hypothetical protein
VKPLNITLFGEGVLADVIKDFEMKISSWITLVGPEDCHK